jgi:integrase
MVLLPEWLPELGKKEEDRRAGYGLIPKSDGWYKTIAGKTRYVCKPLPLDQAIEELQRRFPHAAPPPETEQPKVALTLDRLIEMYLARQLLRVQTGKPKKLARRTYDDHAAVLFRFAEVVGGYRAANGFGPEDFAKWGQSYKAGAAVSTIRREFSYLSTFFVWAAPGRKGMGLIPEMPNFGADWIRPTDDQLRVDLAKRDKAMLPRQIKAIFKAVKAYPLLNAAAHLGLNGGFIPIDIATLPEDVVDLKGREIIFSRGKTGMARYCWLMPQTVKALREYLKTRPQRQPGCEHLFFVNSDGGPLAKDHVDSDDPAAPVSDSSGLMREWWRAGVGKPFSGLRSTFATIADNTWDDERAIDMVLGHKVGRKQGHVRSTNYSKYFNPSRARLLCEHVWRLAFGRGGRWWEAEKGKP